jgi:hypothetical protein
VPIGFAIIEGISRNVKWVIAIGGWWFRAMRRKCKMHMCNAVCATIHEGFPHLNLGSMRDSLIQTSTLYGVQFMRDSLI